MELIEFDLCDCEACEEERKLLRMQDIRQDVDEVEVREEDHLWDLIKDSRGEY